MPGLEAVAKDGLSEEARETAAAALTALGDKKLVMATDGQKHVMLSCESILDALLWSICAAAYANSENCARLLEWCSMQTSGRIKSRSRG